MMRARADESAIPRQVASRETPGSLVFENFGHSVIVFYECTSEHYQRKFLTSIERSTRTLTSSRLTDTGAGLGERNQRNG